MDIRSALTFTTSNARSPCSGARFAAAAGTGCSLTLRRETGLAQPPASSSDAQFPDVPACARLLVRRAVASSARCHRQQEEPLPPPRAQIGLKFVSILTAIFCFKYYQYIRASPTKPSSPPLPPPSFRARDAQTSLL